MPINDYTQRSISAARKLQMAKALQQQIAHSSHNPNQMVGGQVVPINPLGVALNTFTGGLANAQAASAEDERAKIEDERRSGLVQALSGGGKVTPELLANNGASADDMLKFAMSNQPKEVDPWKNTPTGYRPNPDGTISSMIDKETGQPYSAIQLERAIATKQQPGYGQEEANARAAESLSLQQESAARSAQQQQISNANEQERIRMAQESAAKQEQYHNESKLQNVPAVHRMAYINNNASLKAIDDAIAEAEKNPDAFGLKNMLGDDITQRLDPGGVAARAAVAKVGAVQRHELSGAAVPISEEKNLKPFNPSVNDDSKAIIQKLKVLRDNIAGINSQVEQMYSNPEEYKNPIEVMVNPAGVPKSAQYNGVVSKFKLSDVGARLSPDVKKSINAVMNGNDDKEKLKLLQGGLILEGE